MRAYERQIPATAGPRDRQMPSVNGEGVERPTAASPNTSRALLPKGAESR